MTERYVVCGRLGDDPKADPADLADDLRSAGMDLIRVQDPDGSQHWIIVEHKDGGSR